MPLFDTPKLTETRLWDPTTSTYRVVSAEKVADDCLHERTWAEASLSINDQDPLNIALFFAHLRSVLGNCDIEPDVEMTVKISHLNESQLLTLRQLGNMSWRISSGSIVVQRDFYRKYSDRMQEKEERHAA